MLRSFRRSDIPSYLKLLLENFPAEGRLIGFRPEPMVKIISKLFRPDLRFLLGLFRLFGRPVFTILVVEAEGRLAASCLVTYSARSAYLSAVVTDPAFRRRGFARQLLHRGYDCAAKARRRYVALDVLTANTPARRLYDAEGFRPLRHAAFYTAATEAATAPERSGVRPLAKADLPKLAEIANARLSAEMREVLPVQPQDLALSPWVTYGLASASEAWVLEEGAGPVGFVRATVGAATESANLTQPILDPRASPEGGAALVRTALAWVRGRGVARVIAEATSGNVEAARALTATGFVEADAIDTLYRPARASPGRRLTGVDIYLFPAVIGGGRGDVEEVLTVGRRLAAAGTALYLFRRRGRPLPRGVEAPYDWPLVRRVQRPVREAPRALTIAPHFGTTVEGPRPGPLGAPGPWALERAAIERAYGRGNVLHVSIEEFARARSIAWLAEERWREGGRPLRWIAGRRRSSAGLADAARFERLYERFRDFGRPDLLTLFPGFAPSRSFERSFPRSVQCGAIAPFPTPPRFSPPRARRIEVLWYASPASSARIAREVVAGLDRTGHRVTLTLRSAHPPEILPTDRVTIARPAPIAPGVWQELWGRESLVLTTGSRSLLEAIARGVPFLYFNGLTGAGRARRRHRPEKLDALVRWLALEGVSPRVVADLRRFGSGQRVAEIVARAAVDPTWRAEFRPRATGGRYPPGFGETGALITEIAGRWSDGSTARDALLSELRLRSRARRASLKV